MAESIMNPNGIQSGKNFEAELCARRVAAVEGKARIVEELNDKAARRRNRILITNIIGWILVVAALFFGWRYWSEKKAADDRRRLAAALERARIAEEQAANERKHQQELREAQEKERAKRKAEEDRRRAAEEAAAVERRATCERFGTVASLFEDGGFGFVRDLAKDKLPGSVDGTFYFVLPYTEDKTGAFVVCDSKTDGTFSTYRILESGEKLPYVSTDFLSSLQKKDYLMLTPDEKVYFHARREKQHVGEISLREPSDLSDEFFASIAEEVRDLMPKFDDVQFEIVFMPKAKKGEKVKPIFVETVDYGMRYSLEKVREAVMDAYPMKGVARVKTKTRRLPKRTVVFWDGGMMKTGIDGVTYVPRHPPATPTSSSGMSRMGGSRRYRFSTRDSEHSQQAYERWVAMRDEAERQENEAMAAMESQRLENEESMERMKDKAMAKYYREITKLIDSGTLFYRARIKK